MTFAEVEQMLKDANYWANEYQRTGSRHDLEMWNLALERMQFAGKVAEMRDRAVGRLGKEIQ